MFNWLEDILLIIFTSGLRSKTSGREGKHAHQSGSSQKKNLNTVLQTINKYTLSI